MCLYPQLIKNRKYIPNKKNRGHPPPIPDNRVTWVPIGCQQCIECRKQKARDWQVRLSEDIKEHTNGKFITLTFNEERLEHNRKKVIEKYYQDISKSGNEALIQFNMDKLPQGYEMDNEIATYAVRKFLERWRKEYGEQPRHWLITELGHKNTERVHLHGIIWTDEHLDRVEHHWKNGWVWKGKEHRGKTMNYVNGRTINYIIKYVTKLDEKHPGYKGKILASKGIGKRYTQQGIGDWQSNKFNGENTKETYRTPTGQVLPLPIYMRNKIYTEQEREKLWIYKLDKQQRYVLGQKISIKNGEEEYEAALKEAQKWNKELGYGDGTKTWEDDQYKRNRAEIRSREKIAKKESESPSAGPLPADRV